MIEEQSSLSVSELSRILGRIHAQGAFETDPSKMRYRAAEVRSKLAKLNEETASLKQELLVLDSFLAELSKKEPTAKTGESSKSKPSAQTKSPVAREQKSAAALAKPGVGSPLGHRPKTQQLSPKKRAERAAMVLDAARAVVKRDGPQITAASVAQQLLTSKVDLGVPADRMNTAVGNIIFRAKTEFEWVHNGVYRYTGKGLNGHARA